MGVKAGRTHHSPQPSHTQGGNTDMLLPLATAFFPSQKRAARTILNDLHVVLAPPPPPPETRPQRYRAYRARVVSIRSHSLVAPYFVRGSCVCSLPAE